MPKNMRILVVDDADMMRNLLKQALSQLGYSDLSEAKNGLDALNKIDFAQSEGRTFDLVFIDWNMPVFTGIQVVRKCRENKAYDGVRFVMVTAEQDQKNIIEALNAGVEAYITKPFSPKNIGEKIQKLLAKKAA